MNWRTEIKVPNLGIEMNLSSPMMFAGSCFASHMHQRMSRLHCDVRAFSHGIIFHPLALAKAFQDIVLKRVYSESDLIFSDGLYRSLSHHGVFADTDPTKVLDQINSTIAEAHNAFDDLHTLVITFGTAYGYHHLESDGIVANCHKLPQQDFKKELSNEADILRGWSETIALLRSVNPQLNLIFTVSPVRHWRDGAIENGRSKARLISVCGELASQKGVYYFPSFELMMDDLRDYRFYEADLIHPNAQAIDYIQEKFVHAAFSDHARLKLDSIEKLVKQMEHRSIHESAELSEKRKAEALEGIRLIIESK